MTLTRLVQQGKLERIARGEYALPGASHPQRSSLAVVAERVPRGVICLLSALEFHGLTGQVPFEVWLAVQRDARKPNQGITLRVVYFSGLAFTAGIETHTAFPMFVATPSPQTWRVIRVETSSVSRVPLPPSLALVCPLHSGNAVD